MGRRQPPQGDLGRFRNRSRYRMGALMAYTIKNVRPHAVLVDGVSINPGEQLKIETLTGPISAALDAGDLHLSFGDETREERHANAAAFKPFKTGDPAID